MNACEVNKDYKESGLALLKPARGMEPERESAEETLMNRNQNDMHERTTRSG